MLNTNWCYRELAEQIVWHAVVTEAVSDQPLGTPSERRALSMMVLVMQKVVRSYLWAIVVTELQLDIP
ncbi:hypothetical protein O9992_13990 [Vibrio lentus]|nr:hypothetical protein [Vibrio lentus]